MKEGEDNYFNSSATTWDKEPNRRQMAQAIVRGLHSLPLHRQMNVMEYGCGTGLVGLQIAPHVGTLTAIDNATGMLDVLVEKIKQKKITNVRPRCLDLSRDPLLAQFDLIICAMTLHHIAGTDFILRRFVDLLKPGAFLAIADFDLGDPSPRNAAATGKNTVSRHGFERQRLHDLLGELGFSDLEQQTVHVFSKRNTEGNEQEYVVFLLTGRKN